MYCIPASLRGCLTPRRPPLSLRLFLLNFISKLGTLEKIQKSSQQSLPVTPHKTSPRFPLNAHTLPCLCYWTSLPVFRLFLQFILCSVARFIFQNMKSYSSNQNLHSWIKSKPLNLAFNDYQNLAPINLYGLIAIFSNYKSLGFCQISLLSSHLPWTFYIEASHLCHKEFLPLPSSCHCSRPFCISTFIT